MELSDCFSQNHCLVFVAFLASALKKVCYIEMFKMVSRHFAHKLLLGCGTACVEVIENAAVTLQSEVSDVVKQLCIIYTDTTECFMEFILYGYPFLPLQHFMRILRQHVSAKLYLYNENTTSETIQSVVRKLCEPNLRSTSISRDDNNNSLEESKEMMERMQRFLSLDHQLTLVKCLGELSSRDTRVHSMFQKSKEILESQSIIKVQEAGKKDDIKTIHRYCGLMHKESLVDDLETFCKATQKALMPVLEKGRVESLDNVQGQLKELLLSGVLFKEEEDKIKVLQVLTESKHKDSHYLFLHCLQNAFFKIVDSEQMEKLLMSWFRNAVKFHCGGRTVLPSDYISSVYSYLGDVLVIQFLTNDTREKLQEEGFHYLSKMDILEAIGAISNVEKLGDPCIETWYRKHVQRFLKDGLSKEAFSMADLVQKVCGRGSRSLIINSR